MKDIPLLILGDSNYLPEEEVLVVYPDCDAVQFQTVAAAKAQLQEERFFGPGKSHFATIYELKDGEWQRAV